MNEEHKNIGDLYWKAMETWSNKELLNLWTDVQPNEEYSPQLHEELKQERLRRQEDTVSQYAEVFKVSMTRKQQLGIDDFDSSIRLEETEKVNRLIATSLKKYPVTKLRETMDSLLGELSVAMADGDSERVNEVKQLLRDTSNELRELGYYS